MARPDESSRLRITISGSDESLTAQSTNSPKGKVAARHHGRLTEGGVIEIFDGSQDFSVGIECVEQQTLALTKAEVPGASLTEKKGSYRGRTQKEFGVSGKGGVPTERSEATKTGYSHADY